jgi:hypothetical protein
MAIFYHPMAYIALQYSRITRIGPQSAINRPGMAEYIGRYPGVANCGEHILSDPSGSIAAIGSFRTDGAVDARPRNAFCNMAAS